MKLNRLSAALLILLTVWGGTPLTSAHVTPSPAAGDALAALITPEQVAYFQARAPHVAGTPTTSAQARQSVARWTVMVYLAADNDLEARALIDLNEMEFVGSTTEINVVAQLDRSEQYDASNGDWTDTRRFFVTRDTNPTAVASEEVANLGETNTGDPATLVDFVTWAIATYPAERHALVIWDHGGSWLGVASDNSATRDDLTLPELAQALAQITTETGVGALDLIGFDACLMGAFEVYRAIAPYAQYGVGSAELIPGNGWDYFGALDALVADPAMSGDALGRAVVDSYITFYTEVETTTQVVNLGLVDLGKTERLVTTLDDVSSAMGSAPEALAAIIAARVQTPVFGAFRDPQYVDIWAAADLIQFMRLLSDTASGSALSQAAQDAAQAGSEMVLHYRSSDRPDATNQAGMSIYFPRTARLFEQGAGAARYTQEIPSGLDRWNSFLGTVFATVKDQADVDSLLGAAQSITINAAQASATAPPAPGETKAALVVSLSVSRDQSILVDYTPLTGAERDVAWPGLVPWLTDGLVWTPVLVLRDTRDPNLGVVDGMFYARSGEPVEAQLAFDLTTNQLVSVWGLRRTASSVMPYQIAPQPGDVFHPAWFSSDPSQRWARVPANVQLVFGDTLIELWWEPAPLGAYQIAVQIEDAAGNTAQQEIEVGVTDYSDDALVIVEIDPDDPDFDGDGIPNEDDFCPVLADPDQEDYDDDGVGDACDYFDDFDGDGDGVPNEEDACPAIFDPEQDGAACDLFLDSDSDGTPDDLDLCPDDYDPVQIDADWDGTGDSCDPEIAYEGEDAFGEECPEDDPECVTGDDTQEEEEEPLPDESDDEGIIDDGTGDEGFIDDGAGDGE
jgi:hypothetical protein